MKFGKILSQQNANEAVIGREYYFCNFSTSLLFFKATGLREGHGKPIKATLTGIQPKKLFAFRVGEKCYCYALEILRDKRDRKEKNKDA